MPDKMPPDIRRQFPLLSDQFLDIILPKIPLTHRIQRQDIRGRFGLRNRNQLNTCSQLLQYAPIIVDCYSHVKIVQREDTLYER